MEEESYECPYCGEVVTALLDPSAGDQEYIEDCPVCCRPITFELQVHDGEWMLNVRSENE